jgi:hypothetical protein
VNFPSAQNVRPLSARGPYSLNGPPRSIDDLALSRTLAQQTNKASFLRADEPTETTGAKALWVANWANLILVREQHASGRFGDTA